MVNGPLDFLFRRPNSKDNKNSGGIGGTDFLVHGWRLPHFGRIQNDDDRGTSDGSSWVYGIRRAPGLRDHSRGWRTTTALGVSPVFTASTSPTTTTATTTTEKHRFGRQELCHTREGTWEWCSSLDVSKERGDKGAILGFIREHKNELVLALGILLFLLVSICGCVCINWRSKRRRKMRRRRQQRGSRNVDEVPHNTPHNSALQMHQLHNGMHTAMFVNLPADAVVGSIQQQSGGANNNARESVANLPAGPSVILSGRPVLLQVVLPPDAETVAASAPPPPYEEPPAYHTLPDEMKEH